VAEDDLVSETRVAVLVRELASEPMIRIAMDPAEALATLVFLLEHHHGPATDPLIDGAVASLVEGISRLGPETDAVSHEMLPGRLAEPWEA